MKLFFKLHENKGMRNENEARRQSERGKEGKRRRSLFAQRNQMNKWNGYCSLIRSLSQRLAHIFVINHCFCPPSARVRHFRRRSAPSVRLPHNGSTYSKQSKH